MGFEDTMRPQAPRIRAVQPHQSKPKDMRDVQRYKGIVVEGSARVGAGGGASASAPTSPAAATVGSITASTMRLSLSPQQSTQRLQGGTTTLTGTLRPDPHAQTIQKQAWMLSSTSAFHAATQEEPPLRKSIRKETDQKIYKFEMEQKALVLSLREVEHSANQEYKRLVLSEAALQAELEAPRRTIWIVNECVHRRSQRPNTVPDETDARLKEEKALGEAWKGRLEMALAQTKALLRTLEGERARMADLIAKEKQPLGVNSEAYSGAVLQYARPQGNPPKEVTDLERSCKESRRLRAQSDKDMAQCDKELEDMRSQLAEAFRASISKSKAIHSDLVLSQGENRAAMHAAKRKEHLTHIAHERNLGPTQGKFLTTAEKLTRPHVRSYGQAAHSNDLGVGNDVHVTLVERSDYSDKSFAKSLSVARSDISSHETVGKNLADAIHDRTKSIKIDQEILLFRNRSQPARRLLTKP